MNNGRPWAVVSRAIKMAVEMTARLGSRDPDFVRFNQAALGEDEWKQISTPKVGKPSRYISEQSK